MMFFNEIIYEVMKKIDEKMFALKVVVFILHPSISSKQEMRKIHIDIMIIQGENFKKRQETHNF